jgi:intein-encoded DNA endonuclease-like protein
MPNKEISLLDLADKFGYFHIKIDQRFLKELLVKATNDEKPHCNAALIKDMGMKPTPNKNYCYTVYSWTNCDKTIPLEKLAKIARQAAYSSTAIESKILSIKAGQHGGEVRPKFPIKFSKELGSMIGHILGDGSISADYKQVFFSNTNKELLKEFANNMDEIFRIKPRIWMQRKTIAFKEKTRWERRLKSIDELEAGKSCSLFYPATIGLILNEIFEQFAIGKSKKLPEIIFRLNKDFKRGLIRAFFDDEGTVDINSHTIRLFQDNENILEAFRLLLSEFGICAATIRNYTRRGKKHYYFSIHRKSNFLKFYKEIGFTSKEKLTRLKELSIVKRQSNVL